MSPLVLAVVGLGIAAAQPPAVKVNPQQIGATRFAVVNIGLVFNNYEKAQVFKKELESTLQPYKVKAKTLQDRIADWEAQISRNPPAPKTEELRVKVRDAKRQLEDMSSEITRLIGKKQEDNLVQLWKEVQAGIHSYATQNGIEVVFGYGDPIEKELLGLFPSVNRKMQAMDLGSTVPLFVTPRAEIGDAVADLLNKQYRSQKNNTPKVPPIDLD
jgi:Skp family chaperone for outer membrane proteins